MISFILINAFGFDQSHHFLYKYLCLCFNKSVLNWTFCQSFLHPKKNPIAQNYIIDKIKILFCSKIVLECDKKFYFQIIIFFTRQPSKLIRLRDSMETKEHFLKFLEVSML
jgi:hypothetical protein